MQGPTEQHYRVIIKSCKAQFFKPPHSKCLALLALTSSPPPHPSQAAAIVDGCRPEPNWPQQGRVTFNNYSTRYREGLNLVLKRITFNIAGGEKVGTK